MALLPDISVSALSGDNADEKINSIVRQLNEWGRILSNESPSTFLIADDGVLDLEYEFDAVGPGGGAESGADDGGTVSYNHNLTFVPTLYAYTTSDTLGFISKPVSDGSLAGPGSDEPLILVAGSDTSYIYYYSITINKTLLQITLKRKYYYDGTNAIIGPTGTEHIRFFLMKQVTN